MQRPQPLVLFALALLFPATVTAPAQDAPEPRQWLWRFVAGGATVGSGAFAENGTYYFASEDRYLYALDRHGTMIWRTDLGRRPGGSVIVAADESVLVTLANGDLLALNPDGRLLWRERVSDQHAFAPLALGNGVIVTVRGPGVLEARSHVGRLLWSVELDITVSAAPVLSAAGEIVVAGTQGDLVLVSVDGRLLRRRYVGEVATTLAATDAGVILGSRGGRIVGLDLVLEPLWRADVGSAVRAVRVGTGGDSYVTSEDGALSRVVSGGAVAWKTSIGSASMRSALVSEDVLVAMSDGVLARLTGDATARWQMRLLGAPLSMSMAPYGSIVVTTESWVTYAYPLSFTPSGSWAEDRGGSARRGVSRAAGSGRVDLSVYERSADYLALRALLLAGGQSEQAVAMADIIERVRSGDPLGGDHQYLMQLSERVAGSPYFGPLTQFGPQSASRRAREQAIVVLGEIGDLTTAGFLARLLRYEPDPTLQTTILRSMAALATPIDEELSARLAEIVRRDVASGASDSLGAGVVAFIERAATYRGGHLHPSIADVLLSVATSNYSRQVRSSALEVVRGLAGGRAP
ncbi:MAG: PQQ-binding-like beta-propeller repeat protein [Spirochaetota bacterium]